MRQLGEYVVSLTAAALISSVLFSLFPDGTVRRLLRLVCGVFLTVTALSPLPGISIPDLSFSIEEYRREGEALAAMGEEVAAQEANGRIKQAMETYILDKATALNAEIQVEIRVGRNGGPDGVILTGQFNEATQQQLREMLTKELGIPEENQQWIQEN